MNRPRATSWLALRIPPAEKQALREEARKRGLSMSALVRINNMVAREALERAQLMQSVYPNDTESFNNN